MEHSQRPCPFLTSPLPRLNTNHTLIDQQLAKQLRIPSSTAERSLGFFIGNRDADKMAKGRYLFRGGSGNGYLRLSIISLDGQVGAVFVINKAPNPCLTPNISQYDFIKSSLKVISKAEEWLI